MIITGLRHRAALARLLGLRQKRYGNLLDFCSQSASTPNRGIKTFLDFIRNHIEENFSRYPQLKFRQLSRGTLASSFTFASAISALDNGTEKNRRISRRARQWPNTIVRHRQRNHARRVYPAKPRLTSHNPAQRRGYSNGAARVRANTSKTKSGSHRRGRTSARTPRNSRVIPRISRCPIVRIIICDPISKLVHVVLAHQNCSTLFQSSNDRRIPFGKIIAKNLRSGGSANALSTNIVFERKWNTMQKPTIDPRFALSFYAKLHFRSLRLHACQFIRHRDERI